MSQTKKTNNQKEEPNDQENEVLLDSPEKISELINKYQADIEKLEKENKSLKENSLRAMADVENIKKRTEKEISDTRKYTLSKFIENLVPIIENLYRSTEHITDEQKKDEVVVKIVEGIEMTQNDFIQLLEKQGVKRIMPNSGDDFDHNYHQAISTVSHEGAKSNSINNVIQAGYSINDRLIRPALVVVNS